MRQSILYDRLWPNASNRVLLATFQLRKGSVSIAFDGELIPLLPVAVS